MDVLAANATIRKKIFMLSNFQPKTLARPHMGSFILSALCLLLLSVSSVSSALATQFAPVALQADDHDHDHDHEDAEAKKKKAEQEKKEAEAKAEEEAAVSTESLKQEAPEIDSQFLRFEMWDGTVVSGIVSIEAIDVDTEFGRLRIPIDRLVDFLPGLKSLPEFREKVNQLVEDLGDREFKIRESAHRELVDLGPLLLNLLPTLEDGGSAERKKHLVKIREEVETLIEEQTEELDEPVSAGISDRDRIQTPDFSIAGKILQEEFQVKSKIGDLRIMLADVKRADRGVVLKAQTLRKTIYVPGSTFFQKKPVSAKIRVSKGDRIFVSASGVVQWTNWSQSATPEGLPNQGNHNGLPLGSLAARIGKEGEIVGLGSDGEFTAKKSGILYLGVVMSDNYVNNTGYRWTGKFKAKVKVSPAQ